MLAQAGAAIVWGCDVSEEAVRYAREHHRHGRVTFTVSDAMVFTPVEPPDVWVSLETIEHLQDPSGYLRRISGILESGGVLVASVPTTVSTDGNPYHLHNWSRRQWLALVARSGFSVMTEMRQVHRFGLRDVIGQSVGTRQKVRSGLLRYYLVHPRVAWARFALSITRGLMHEYSTVVARKR